MNRDVTVSFNAEDKNFSTVTKGVSKSIEEMYSRIRESVSKSIISPDFTKEIAEKVKKLQADLKNSENAIKNASAFAPKGTPQYEAFMARQVSKHETTSNELDALRALQNDVTELEKRKYEEEKRERIEKKLQEKTEKELEKTEKRKDREEEKEENRRGRGVDSRMVDVLSIVKAVAQAKDIYQATSSSVPAITAALTGNVLANGLAGFIGDLSSKAFDKGGQYLRAAGNLSQITGRSQDSLMPNTNFQNHIDNFDERINTFMAKRTAQITNKESGVTIYMNGKDSPNDMYNLLSQEERNEYDQLLKGKASLLNARVKEEFNLNAAVNMGYNATAYANMRGQYSRASGKFDETGEGALSTMHLIKGLGIDENTAMSLTKSGRSSGVSSLEMAQSMFSNLNARGKIMTKDDTSLLPEYLQILIDVNSKQLEKLGSVDRGVNEGMIASIASLGKNFANPDLLKSILPKFQEGFGESQNPQIRAMQYQTMSEMGVGNIFEMRKMMENPMANREYISAMVGKYKKMAGGNNQLAASMLAQTVGISQTMAEEVMGTGEGEGTNWETFTSKKREDKDIGWIKNTRSQVNYGTTGEEASESSFDKRLEELGVKLIKKVDVLQGYFQSMVDDTEKMEAEIKINNQATKMILANVKDLIKVQEASLIKIIDKSKKPN